MARFTRLEVYQKIDETGLIPLFYEPDFERAKDLLIGCYNGGVRVVEITNRGDFAHEVFGNLIKWANGNLPELILGVGTVVDSATAALYIQLGTNFVVTPVFYEDIARVCNRRMIGWLSGCATLTEISRAQEFGAEIVKVFPGEILSPAFVKGALGPMSWSKIMPTGGVEPTLESLTAWFNAGVVCVGMGSKLFPKGATADEVSEKVRFCIETIKKIKNNG